MTLTQRQREVLALLASSKTTKETGALLGISAKTVEYHRAKIYRALGLRDLAGLVRYAIRERFIT